MLNIAATITAAQNKLKAKKAAIAPGVTGWRGAGAFLFVIIKCTPRLRRLIRLNQLTI